MRKDPVQPEQKWEEKIFDADQIWAALKEMLEAKGTKLSQTLRRPDIRLILNNITGQEIRLYNPGDHSDNRPEIIPGTGDKTAVMVIVKGQSLPQQFENAEKLVQKYQLDKTGLTEDIAKILSNREDSHIDEAYGPAPYQEQVSKLTPVVWITNDGAEEKIDVVQNKTVAYGARPATKETVFLIKSPICVKGTDTTPEQAEQDGICIAISSDEKTGKETTRPIVPSAAKEFYGTDYKNLPTILIHPDGHIQEIDLGNGKED